MAVVSSSLISCFPGMLLRYFMNDLEMALGALLLLVSLLLLQSTHAVFLLEGLHILESLVARNHLTLVFTKSECIHVAVYRGQGQNVYGMSLNKWITRKLMETCLFLHVVILKYEHQLYF
jgi:hypothetical protein